VRSIGEIFEFINDIKKVSDNINFFISIYFGVGAGAGDVKFFKKYKIPAERAGRKIVTGIKNFAYPQFFSKRRKLIRL
jgi:hypothetical protein